MESAEARRARLHSWYATWDRKTLAGHFRDQCKRFPDDTFLITPHSTYTYADVWNESVRVAKALYAGGVKRRQHVALLMANEPEFIFTLLAVAMIGAVAVPLNTLLREEELEYILCQSDSEWLLFHQRASGQSHEENIRRVVESIRERGERGLERIVMIRNQEDGATESVFLDWETLLAGGAEVSDEAVDARLKDSDYPDETAMIIYTSGSTGAPKGVMLTHQNFLRCAYSTCLSRAFEPGRRIFTPLPLYHVFALEEGLLAASFVGGCVITVAGFSPRTVLEMMAQHQAHDFLCVPSMLVALLNQPDVDQYNLTHLYALMAAAAPAPVPLWKRAVETFRLKEICTGYGGTEVTASTVHTEVGDPIDVIATRAGRIKPGGVSGLPEFGGANVEYKVVDPDTGHDLPTGSMGELTVRGNIVTRGYYRNPEANEAVIDKDGWLRTGDLGRLHEGGYIEFLGRNKEMYKVSGENVSAKEVEETISQYPAVAQVYVVGVADALTDQTGAAFIELKPGMTCTRKDIVGHCQAKLAKFKIPRHVFFVTASEWPMTGTGKIQKFQLQRLAEERIRHR